MLQRRKKEILGGSSWSLLCMHKTAWLEERMSTCCRHYLRYKPWSCPQGKDVLKVLGRGEWRPNAWVCPESQLCSPDRWDIKVFSVNRWLELACLELFAGEPGIGGVSCHTPCWVLYGIKLLPNLQPLQPMTSLLNICLDSATSFGVLGTFSCMEIGPAFLLFCSFQKDTKVREYLCSPIVFSRGWNQSWDFSNFLQSLFSQCMGITFQEWCVSWPWLFTFIA